MALSSTDKPLRKMIARALKKIARIVSRFSKLDDPVWVLKTDQAKINKVISKYMASLTPVIRDSFTGKHIDIISKDAVEEFIKQLEPFKKVSASEGRAKRLGRAVNNNQSKLVKSIVQQLGANQKLKTQTLKQMSLTPFDPTKIVKIGGREYNLDDVDSAWQVLTDTYGTSAQVQFASGKKMPVTQYVDGKLNSLTQEVNNQVTVMEAANNQVATVKISSHRSPDSCRLHENEIVFINSEAKKRFIKENPQLAGRARKMHTLEQIKNDPTHMFKFNCKHRIIPFPMELVPQSKVEDSLTPESLPRNRKEAKNRLQAVMA